MLNKLIYLLILLSSVFFSCKKNIQGCTDEFACNYNAEANTDDSSCELPLANYDCENTCINDADGDGVCDESEIEGCTDSLACNYSMLATESDSSCEFAMTYYDWRRVIKLVRRKRLPISILLNEERNKKLWRVH